MKAEALEGRREGWSPEDLFSEALGLLRERSSSIRDSYLAALSSLLCFPFLLSDAPMKSMASFDGSIEFTETRR